MREAVKKVGREELAVEQKARGEIRWALSGSRCYNHREHTPLPLSGPTPMPPGILANATLSTIRGLVG